MDSPQEVTGLCALDDAMVVGTRECDDLGDRHPCESLFTRTLELCGVIHRTDAKDQALALNETRHRVNGSDRARVGERDSSASEVFDCEGAISRLLHQSFVLGVELRKVE